MRRVIIGFLACLLLFSLPGCQTPIPSADDPAGSEIMSSSQSTSEARPSSPQPGLSSSPVSSSHAPSAGKEPSAPPSRRPEPSSRPASSTASRPADTDSSHTPITSSPAKTGALHVEGTQLMGADGRPVQLRGISTHGISWFPDYINEACFRELRNEWQANVIRLAMYTAESGGYCTGGDRAALKALIHRGVTYATAQDMYVIIDWHILSDANPQRYKQEAKAFFAEMSAKYAGAGNVLYEICNEPNGGTSWRDIKAYAEEVIPVIRANDPQAIILVGTPNWSQYVDQAAADPITGYENIMYTLHFYAATHTDDLRGRMEAAVRAGLPVFVSEYGICDASGNGAINEKQANQWVETMNRHNISYVAWNLSNKNESSAILRSGCRKTSGFRGDDLSDSGKWLYRMLTGSIQPPAAGSAPTSQQPPATTTVPPAPLPSFAQSGQLEFQTQIANQWEENGVPVYQYVLTLHNTSQQAIAGWAAEVTFREDIALLNGWNGTYSAAGKTLRITCQDYNASIPAGGSVSDIGFIVKGGGGIAGIK